MNNRDGRLFTTPEDSNLIERYWSGLPLRLKGVIVIALPMCALLFVSTANIFTDRKQGEADRATQPTALAQAEVSRRQLSSLRRISRAADVFAIAVAIFGFIFSLYLLNRVIIARLAAACEATEALAAGLPIPLRPGGKDEIGALIAGMRHASELLIEREQQLVAKNADLARALASVKEASKHKSRFLANMSHELRTPLNSIIGFTEVVHDKRAGELTETQEEFLGDSLRSARHLLALINDILDLEKIAAGHLVLRPELFDLHQLIGETIHELSVTAAAKNVGLSAELDDLVRRVFLDRQKTKQILLNLVTNALKFTAEGGRVRVSARAAGIGRCVLEIEDTGVGISAEGQTRLFREFEQLESTSTKRLPGTGLGLALTKKLVEAQSGTIAVASRVDVGSTFCVMLPSALEPRLLEVGAAAGDRYTEPLPAAERAQNPMVAKPVEAASYRFEVAGEGQHVLVVDDDINVHKLARMALNDSILPVICCFDGESALIEIARSRPATVVVDLLMPHVDGFNFIARLRHIPGARAIPVVVWTNLDLTAHEIESLLKDVKKVLNKRDGGIARLIQEL